MAIDEIEEFGRILVQQVRNAAIQSCDRNLRPDTVYRAAKRWRDAASAGTEKLASVMVPDCVDEALAHLLLMIDQGVLHLSFSASNGKVVDLVEEGGEELCGWYMGAWRALYSKERFVENLRILMIRHGSFHLRLSKPVA